MTEYDNECEIVPPIMAGEAVEQHLFNTRKIVLHGPINETLATYVASQLQVFATSKHLVWIYICSPGGDLHAAYSIIDQIELSPFPVATVVRGSACSAAAFLTIYGSKGYRFMTKSSTMMLHSPRLDVNLEPIEDHEVMFDFHKRYFKSRFRDLASRTRIKVEKLKEIMKETCWLDANEAIACGFVDKILTKRIECKSNVYEGT